MHTMQAGEFIVNHNGDFSGDVHINKNGAVSVLPFWLLAHIVAQKVRQERISTLEQVGTDELLGLKRSGAVMD